MAITAAGTDSIFEIKNLSVKYRNFYALKDFNLTVKPGEKLGILGQSGSGKTTLCRVIAGIEKKYSGCIVFPSGKKKIQFVFQDPASSLNPRMKIFDIVTEPLVINKTATDDIKKIFGRVINEVGLSSDVAFKYPHQVSGGQRQRISIARTLTVKPDILICDEPVSSIDISLSAQILNLISDIHKKYEFTLIFVSHDISSLYYLTDRIVVLLNGQKMEEGYSEKIIEKPYHPYTKLLISSILSVGKKQSLSLDFFNNNEKINSLCPFASRCPYISSECENYFGELFNVGEFHRVSCVRWNRL